ncbi:hypothetical protein CE91St36_21310 [Christensenellaceae bacterium]|nr:hypothetical protein CE91St36_21310 [Christensenellaceae bacterium]BDF61980.1 hypothetical protein CE91St37_21300 [Christensenellaceae bacterium]
MECKKEKNMEHCTCTYNCARRGLCCECVEHHRLAGEIPGCFFSKKGEASYDRSIAAFIRDQESR